MDDLSSKKQAPCGGVGLALHQVDNTLIPSIQPQGSSVTGLTGLLLFSSAPPGNDLGKRTVGHVTPPRQPCPGSISLNTPVLAMYLQHPYFVLPLLPSLGGEIT